MKVLHYKPFVIRQLKTFEHPEEVLFDGLDRLKRHHVWVSSGTMLGLYRDKDFIPNDTDIDVGIWGGPTREEILKDMEGYRLIREVEHEEKPMQLAFEKDDLIFDIYFYYEEGKTLKNTNEMGEMVKPKYLFETLGELETKYGTIPTPNPLEEYLNIRYGKDWKIPSNKKGLYTKDF